jgi:hypothetical protein
LRKFRNFLCAPEEQDDDNDEHKNPFHPAKRHVSTPLSDLLLASPLGEVKGLLDRLIR